MRPVRVSEVQRDGVTVIGDEGEQRATLAAGCLAADGTGVTVGDVVLLDDATLRVHAILPRRSLVARRAAGDGSRLQPIAANIDTLFIVTSCNADFNPSRLERYLAIARAGSVAAVILLTKSDLCEHPETWRAQAAALVGNMRVVLLDATSSERVDALMPWLGAGRTVAFAGSSGVGKSTLVNTLMRGSAQRTAGIREDDARGRHTTTSRRLFALPQGAWVIDTPGMRELAIGDVSDALEDVFDDVARLGRECRFRDCAHRGDSGCAIEAAVAEGRLDPRRVENWRKLAAEADRAARSDAERRASERRFGRFAKSAMAEKRRRRER